MARRSAWALVITLLASGMMLGVGAGWAWWRWARVEIQSDLGMQPQLLIITRADQARFLHRDGMEAEARQREALIAELVRALHASGTEFVQVSRRSQTDPDGRPPRISYAFAASGAWLGLPYRIQVEVESCLDQVQTAWRMRRTCLRGLENREAVRVQAMVQAGLASWATHARTRLASLVPLLRPEPERDLPALVEAP